MFKRSQKEALDDVWKALISVFDRTPPRPAGRARDTPIVSWGEERGRLHGTLRQTAVLL